MTVSSDRTQHASPSPSVKVSAGRCRLIAPVVAVCHILSIIAFPVTTKAAVPIPRHSQRHAKAVSPAGGDDFDAWIGLGITAADPLRFTVYFPYRGGSAASREISKRDHAALLSRARRLLLYFLTALSLPEDDIWVNLSPSQNDPTMGRSLEGTLLGDVMLEQDRRLKQAVAWAIHPKSSSGAAFWAAANDHTGAPGKDPGAEPILVDKVWIESDRAAVDFDGRNIWIREARLRVVYRNDDPHNAPIADAFRRTVLPELTERINEDDAFQDIRDIHRAVIFATWFRCFLRGSFWVDVWGGAGPVKGMQSPDRRFIEHVRGRYLDSFRNGEYELVRIEPSPDGRRRFLRRYAAGGVKKNFGLRRIPARWSRRVPAALLAVVLSVSPRPLRDAPAGPPVSPAAATPSTILSDRRAEEIDGQAVRYPFAERFTHWFWDRRFRRLEAMMALIDWMEQMPEAAMSGGEEARRKQRWKDFMTRSWDKDGSNHIRPFDPGDMKARLDEMERIYGVVREQCRRDGCGDGARAVRWMKDRLEETAARLAAVYQSVMAHVRSRVFPNATDWRTAHDLVGTFIQFVLENETGFFMEVSTGERWDEALSVLMIRYGKRWPRELDALLGQPAVLFAFLMQYYDLLDRTIVRYGDHSLNADLLSLALQEWRRSRPPFDDRRVWLRVLFSDLFTRVQLTSLSTAERDEARTLLIDAARHLLDRRSQALLNEWLREKDAAGSISVASRPENLLNDLRALSNEWLDKEGFYIIWDQRPFDPHLVGISYAVKNTKTISVGEGTIEVVLLRRLDHLAVDPAGPAEIVDAGKNRSRIFIHLPNWIDTAGKVAGPSTFKSFLEQTVIHEVMHHLYKSKLGAGMVRSVLWRRILAPFGSVSPIPYLKQARVREEAAAYLSMAVYHQALDQAVRYWIEVAIDSGVDDRHRRAARLILSELLRIPPDETEAFFAPENRGRINDVVEAFLARPDARAAVIRLWKKLFPVLADEPFPALPALSVTQVDGFRRPRRRRSDGKKPSSPGGLDLTDVTLLVEGRPVEVPTAGEETAARLRAMGVHPEVIGVSVVANGTMQKSAVGP